MNRGDAGVATDLEFGHSGHILEMMPQTLHPFDTVTVRGLYLCKKFLSLIAPTLQLKSLPGPERQCCLVTLENNFLEARGFSSGHEDTKTFVTAQRLMLTGTTSRLVAVSRWDKNGSEYERIWVS